MGDYLEKGVTFQSGSQVTHTDLNNLVDNAVVKSEAIGYENLKSGSIADSIFGFPILILGDISNQDYFLVWSATHNTFRKVQKDDFVNSITQDGLVINGEQVVDATGKVFATLSQPAPNQILFNGKEFRFQANEEEKEGLIKIIGRLDGPDGVEIYNEWEVASHYTANKLSFTPDADNVGASPQVRINADVMADGYLNADGTPLVLGTTNFFSVIGTSLVMGSASSAYNYESASNSLFITSGAMGDATWTELDGVLDINTNN